jgi:hypothetical protein
LIHVLYFSDRDVKRKLFERVEAAKRPLLVTATRHGKQMTAIEAREPFASIERQLGDVVDQVVVADEGTVEGMWRDPVTDLADALFPDDSKKAYAAATGWMLLVGGRPKAVVKKRGSKDDLWRVQEALSKVDASVPPPSASRKPRIEDQPTDPRARAPKPRVATGSKDPYGLLGIARDATPAEAKKAFRALISQYHPDKVAHLAEEFRVLAETRTRQILEAWQQVEQELAEK